MVEVETITRRLALTGFLANFLGAMTVLVFLVFVFPSTLSPEEFDRVVRRSLAPFFGYTAIALPVGWFLIAHRGFRPLARWLRASRPATDTERRLALRYPRDWALRSTVVWLGAAGLFAAINATEAAATIVGGVMTTALGGVTACTLQYLLVERIIRPVTALALAGGPPPDTKSPGVAALVTVAWALATGVPVLGIAAFTLIDVTGADYEPGRTIGSALALSLVALFAGLAAILLAVRSVADPLGAMRGALARVESGELTVEVPVDDGSEVGLLEAGFNRMTRGLAERERLREAFGVFVDPGLAERVLAEGTDFAGEEVELSLLFLDVRGFTSFSERASAQQVVAMLNDLYGAVVPVILAHGGHANKFIGDGLLAVFGAPDRLADHADRAVGAALKIAGLVERRYAGEVRMGLGVNSGRVVVGTIGGGGRLDFTVIGDPVNTAARVESATRQTGDDVLITPATRALLSRDFGGWIERPAISLKGKRTSVSLFAPAGNDAPLRTSG